MQVASSEFNRVRSASQGHANGANSARSAREGQPGGARLQICSSSFGLRLATAGATAGLLLAVWTTGCARQAESDTATAPAVSVRLASPEEAARSLVGALRALLEAKANRSRTAAKETQDTIIDRLMAREEILARLAGVSARLASNERKSLETLADNWAAIVSYYAADLDLTHASVVSSVDGTAAAVDIPARGPQDAATLRVTCRTAKDGQWRISSLELAPPAVSHTAGTMPTTSTTSPASTNPASAPAK